VEPAAESDLRERVHAAAAAVPAVRELHNVSLVEVDGRNELSLHVKLPGGMTLAEAHDLAALARRTGRILQVGHLERFNPAIVHLRSLLHAPRFIECHRLAPFTERGTDVDVVLDLMVHDLDVVLSATAAQPQSVEAVGVAVLTDQIDVANARIRFVDGMIANLNTSRVAPRRERKIRFFQPDAYISLDYEARRIQIYRKTPAPPGSTYPVISAEQVELGDGDPLMDEIAAFVHCVRTRTAPSVDAAAGLRVMELSELIRRSISAGGSPASMEPGGRSD
jgi:predicted dehydrogenase